MATIVIHGIECESVDPKDLEEYNKAMREEIPVIIDAIRRRAIAAEKARRRICLIHSSI